MKKIALLFLVAMFVMFGMISKAQAAENYVEINLYEHENFNDFTEIEGKAANYLLYYINNGPITLEESGDHDTNDYIANYYRNEKKFATATDNGTELSSEFFLDSFTRDDEIEYKFNEEDKFYFQNNGWGQELNAYDGIIVRFSNKPGTVLIKEIELIEQKGMAVINSPAKINGLNIDVDVKFKDVNDKVVYKALVKNNTDTDYYLTKGNMNSDDEYINYEFGYEGDNDIIKAGETKNVTITMTYTKEVPVEMLVSGTYESTNKINFVLSTERIETTANPKTVDTIVKTVMVLVISVALLILMVKVQMIRKAMMVVLALVMVMPLVAKAIERINITINTSVVVTKNPSFVIHYNDDEAKYYEFEEGMTWEQWLESNLNTDDIDSVINIMFETKEYDTCRKNNPVPDRGAKPGYSDPCLDYYGDVELDDVIGPFTQVDYYKITMTSL